MESEKVKIKKGLECCSKISNPNYTIDEQHKHCCKCPYSLGKYRCSSELKQDALAYINELESENERLKIVVDIANERDYRKKFIDEWRKEYQKELDKQGNGHIAGYPDFDLVYKLYFEQKDRIAELEKEKKDYIEEKILREIIAEADKKTKLVGDCDEIDLVTYYTIPDYKLKSIAKRFGAKIKE